MPVTNRGAINEIAMLREFKNSKGSLVGKYQFHTCEFGRLSMNWRRSLQDEMRSVEELKLVSYIIYSYATPIAWFINTVWYMPEDKYSVTTSKHQGIVRLALSGSHCKIVTTV